MDEHAIGVVGIVVWCVVGLVAALGLTAGGMWAADYGVEATVVNKECGGPAGPGGPGGIIPTASQSKVTVKTKLLGITHTLTDFPDDTCRILRAGDDGNFVRYHLRSEHTILFEREGGPCIYDSKTITC